MRAIDLIHFSWLALVRNRFRTLMLLIAVTLGVGSVIVLTALGEGARLFVMGEFAALGTDILVVVPGRNETTGGLPPMTGGSFRDITLQDAESLARLPGIRAMAPIVIGSAQVSRGRFNRESLILGTTSHYLPMRHLELAVGKNLPAHSFKGRNVCVIGQKLKHDLFQGQSPLGQWLRIGDSRFRVIGVLAQSGGAFGMDLSDMVFIPVANAQNLFNVSGLFRVMLQLEDNSDIDTVKARVLAVMTERHEGETDVTVISPDAMLSSFNSILATMTLAVAGIGGISLLVAGILIMNMTLISVSQRTREIGLLKALGATSAQIRKIFLVESLILTLIGGLCGLVAAEGLLAALYAIYPQIHFQPPLWSIVMAIAIAMITGLLFAWLPANRAARLEPVAALTGR